MKILLLAAMMIFSVSQAAQSLSAIELKGDKGGRLDGKAWSSNELKGKVHVLFYVDPDEKDLNEHVGQALQIEKFPLSNYASVAIINMAATWLPNFALESALKKKQEKYPNTIYVKDLDKKLVKEWGLKDDSSNVLLFNKQGELIFRISGKAKDKEVQNLVELIKKNLQ